MSSFFATETTLLPVTFVAVNPAVATASKSI
jgi:hypothetical protein